MNKELFKISSKIILIISLTLILSTGNKCFAADSQQEILKKLETMESQIAELKKQLKVEDDQESSEEKSEVATQQPSSDSSSLAQASPAQITEPSFVPKFDDQKLDPGLFGITYRSNGTNLGSMRLGAYGETKFGRKQTAEGWKNGFDASRVVLLGTYQIDDNILFNTEIEFEHGGIAKEADDKLDGAIEVEQLFVDFNINDHFSWRAPGVDVVPVGYVGLFHEPTQYYSVDRPALYRGIIPSTWFTPSTSLYGKVIDNLTYQFQISSSVEDIGAAGTDSDSSVPSGGYDAGISGTGALGLSRAPIGSRRQVNNNLAYTARLAYSPPAIAGLSGSTSFYYTPDTSPRGAYGTNPDGTTRLLGKSDLALFDTEVRYRIPSTGLELRTEYVNVAFGNPDNLRANNNGDATDNVGDNMYGYLLEAAYHYNLSSSSQQPWELVPFYRYTFQNFQTSGVAGTDLNMPTGAGEQDFHTFGFSLFPTPKVVLKLDYSIVSDKAPNSPKSNSFLGSVGFFF